MRLQIERPDGGAVPGIRLPIRFSDTQLPQTRPAPTLGGGAIADVSFNKVKA
jgi:crotonobetainyl-CoA:carnitine CoA-transferase CaiB-like acyl-CoA transferase